MIKKVIGIALIVACAACSFYAYDQYMEQTEGARAVDDFAQSTGLSKVIGDDATEPEIPTETIVAGIGAALTGIAGLVLIIRS